MAVAAPPPSVLQVDAARLDAELLRLITPGWTYCLQFLTASGRGGGMSEEASAFLLSAVVHALTVVAGRPPPGAAMLGLNYTHARLGSSGNRVPAVVWRKRFVHFLVSVALPGVHRFALAALLRRHRGALETRLAREQALLAEHVQEEQQQQQQGAAKTWLRAKILMLVVILGSDVALETLARGIALVHGLLFVSSRGRYRSLADRLSGLTLEYGDRRYEDGGRMLSFDYLNQQLVWRETSDLFKVVLPAAAAAASAVAGAAAAAGADIGLRWSSSSTTKGRGGAKGTTARVRSSEDARSMSDEDMLEKLRDEVDVDEAACCRCGVVGNHAPYVTLPCLHIYCYYCIAQHTAAVGGSTRSNSSGGGERAVIASAARCAVCYQRIKAVAPLRRRVCDIATARENNNNLSVSVTT